MTEAKKLSPAEGVKEKSRYLRGTIKESLQADTSHFAGEDSQLLKFHGTYQQDNRDTRQDRLKEKSEKDYMMMVRSKVPGGRMSAEQYLAHDELASKYGNGTLRITTRQGFQFHGVLKKNLKAVIRGINERFGTTSGACGDIVRNVMACPAPLEDRLRTKIFEYAKAVSDQFLSRSGAYQEIWLDGERVDTQSRRPEEVEPIYGKVYLPRKFKIALAFPGDNCVDVFTNDIGIIPEISAGGNLTGFNIVVGGGLGMTHGIASTYPRLATPLCFVSPEDLLGITKAIVLVQRDNGNRSDRKQARMKYLIDKMGMDWFRSEAQKRFGKKIEPPHEIKTGDIHNHLGWHRSGDGQWFYGISVENGRIKDEGNMRLKSGLRAAVERFRPEVYLTAQQDLLLSGFAEAQKPDLEALLASYGIRLSAQVPQVRQDAMGCPALPTCALAISESERVLPSVMDEMEKIVADLKLEDQRFLIRMTGCPNGCARPYNAEIAFVGRTAGTYNIYVGGTFRGDQMAELVAEKVPLAALAKTLQPLLAYYKEKRQAGESFGDFSRRAGTGRLKELIPAAESSA